MLEQNFDNKLHNELDKKIKHLIDKLKVIEEKSISLLTLNNAFERYRVFKDLLKISDGEIEESYLKIGGLKWISLMDGDDDSDESVMCRVGIKFDKTIADIDLSITKKRNLKKSYVLNYLKKYCNNWSIDEDVLQKIEELK